MYLAREQRGDKDTENGMLRTQQESLAGLAVGVPLDCKSPFENFPLHKSNFPPPPGSYISCLSQFPLAAGTSADVTRFSLPQKHSIFALAAFLC